MKERRTFDNSTESVGQARRFVGQAIQGASSQVLQAVVLMTSELASNCIRHTDSRFALAVTRTEAEIRVEATDRGGGGAGHAPPASL